MPSRGAAALKAASSCPGDVDALRQAGKTLRRAVGLQQPRRHPPEAGRSMGKAPPWRPLGAIFLCHRDPPFWLDRDGQASPVNGNGNFRLTETASIG